jgi:hypothetical protein
MARMTTAIRTAALAVLVLPALAAANGHHGQQPPAAGGERILVLRTTEDARFPPDPAFCAAAPFQPVNVLLGASVWSFRTSPRDGRIVDEDARFLGTAMACGLLTTTAPFVPQPFLIRFDLKDGSYTASGTCTITSNAVPALGVLLVSCTLPLTEFPDGVLGGSATSASLFNLFGLEDYDTGSIWTLRIHDAP